MGSTEFQASIKVYQYPIWIDMVMLIYGIQFSFGSEFNWHRLLLIKMIRMISCSDCCSYKESMNNQQRNVIIIKDLSIKI